MLLTALVCGCVTFASPLSSLGFAYAHEHAKIHHRNTTPQASDDGVVVAFAALLVGAAGALQYSVSSGDKGINAFLMKEKRDNPFYQSGFQSERPSGGPNWLKSFRLPALDFVEVYGQADSSAPGASPSSPELAALYRQLDRAIEREEYDEAAQIKAQIDSAATNRRPAED